VNDYKVNADFNINVEVEVEAENEEEAKEKAVSAIFNKECDWLDPIDEPKINWAECIREYEPEERCICCLEKDCNGECMGDV
jgi:hypothetical protein